MSFNSPFTGNVIQPTDVSYRSVTLTANTQLAWPINGNATNNYAARIMQVTASTGGLSLYMPPADQTSVGNDAFIRNVGANSFTVKDYAGTNTIVTVAAGETKYIYITANPDNQGTWGSIALGSGASGADAAALAGFGLKAIGSTLNQSQPVTTFSNNYTAGVSDRAATYVWTGGAGTLTLTSAVTLQDDWFMLVRNAGTGELTVSPSGGQLINGLASLSMQPADSCFISCSGTAFYTIGLGKSTQFNFTQLTKAVTSGTYVLTSSEAANVIQKYTGVLSGAVTIQLPKTVQVYYITNQTDGTGAGYDITFTTNTVGAATAIVPAGQQVILLCDSANLYNASTVAAGASTLALPNGTAGSPPLYFSSETATGIFRPGSGQFGVTVLGSKILNVVATGIEVTGSGKFSGGISGGTF